LLLGLRRGLVFFDPMTGELQTLAVAPYDSSHERFNDGKTDAKGRFWLGTIYEPRDAANAGLYCFDGEKLVKRGDGITTSNGLAWSPSGDRMYWADTKAHSVRVFDFDMATGSFNRPRTFCAFPTKGPDQDLSTYKGRPDGAAVDTEGCYWVAMFEGARLLRFSPTGDTLADIELPIRCPTMPCFGGADLKTLYLTTSRENRPTQELEREPLAGRVLYTRVDVPGLPSALARAPKKGELR
jgi:sugar lactone lactonase YvrE